MDVRGVCVCVGGTVSAIFCFVKKEIVFTLTSPSTSGLLGRESTRL